MKNFLRSLGLVLACGFILMYFSELVFWARPRLEDSLCNWLSTWFAYSLLAWLFLAAVTYFRVRSIWALYLCGALFGWLAEGVLVQTMYDQLPLQLSWTGLGWHALLGVWFGWYFLRLQLTGNHFSKAALASAGLGLFYGFWGFFWRYEEPATAASTGIFTMYVITSTFLAALAFLIYNRLARIPFHPNPLLTGIIGSLFLLLFAFVAVPAKPWAVLILPPLLGLLMLSLWKNRRDETRPALTGQDPGPVPLKQYLALTFVPLTAIPIYIFFSSLPWVLPTGWFVYIFSMPGGFIILIISLLKVWRRKKPIPTAA
jgi:hypothetical protein